MAQTKNIELPKQLADFIGSKAAADLQRAEDLLNALQNLRVQVTVNGSTQTAAAVIQISGDAALIVISL